MSDSGGYCCLTGLLTLAVAPPTGAFAFSLPALPPAVFSEDVLALPALREEEQVENKYFMMQSDSQTVRLTSSWLASEHWLS